MKYFDVFRYCTKAKEIQSPPNPVVSKSQLFFMLCLKTWKGQAPNHLNFVCKSNTLGVQVLIPILSTQATNSSNPIASRPASIYLPMVNVFKYSYMDAKRECPSKKKTGSIAGHLAAFLEGRVQSQSWVWEAVLSPRRRTRLRVGRGGRGGRHVAHNHSMNEEVYRRF